MPRLEKFSEREFCNDVARLGGEALKQNATINAKIPDRLCWLRGASGRIFWFWAEWKKEDTGALSWGQEVRIRELRKKGHIVLVLDNNKQALVLMKELTSAN